MLGNDIATHTCESLPEWLDVLADEFNLTLDEIPDAVLTQLWTAVRRTHEEWLRPANTEAQTGMSPLDDHWQVASRRGLQALTHRRGVITVGSVLRVAPSPWKDRPPEGAPWHSALQAETEVEELRGGWRCRHPP